MSHLRWHALLRQWVVISPHRQDRPQMPSNWCPFCMDSDPATGNDEALLYSNDFPSFDHNSGEFQNGGEGLFQRTGAPGVCDVVLYTGNHNKLPSELSTGQWRKIVDLWTRRTAELSARPEVQYVMIFENAGEAIGVTMPHPHGQIYAYPFVPPLPDIELRSASDYNRERAACLYCDLLQAEMADGVRVIAENESFAAFVPYAARFPAEVQLYVKRHAQSLSDLQGRESEQLAEMISIVRRKYDNLYGFPLPLMMLVRQAPSKGQHPYFHFHLEFLPIQRSATKLKYLAAVESGSGTFLNDTTAEERAADLRKAAPST
jgi:UDPglucose--hexose-1-phosphate uridylyltransferase